MLRWLPVVTLPAGCVEPAWLEDGDCGDFTGDGAFAWDGHSRAGGVSRFADCTLVPDRSPAE